MSETELRSFLSELVEIRRRSEDNIGREELRVRDRPKLQRVLTEAKAVIAEDLGEDNDFAAYLTRTIDRTMKVGALPEHADEGLEFVEGALNQIKRKRFLQAGSDAEEIPASDRYVTLADNQRDEVAQALAELKEDARGANEVSEEDRLIALSEIAAFEATVVQPRVATDLIQRFVDTVLGWIKRTFTAAAVQEVAQRLILALLKLIA